MSLKIIRQAAVTRLGTLLPTYNELRNVFDIEKNPPKYLNKGFAVMWGEGLSVDGEMRTVPISSGLTVILTNQVPQREADNTAPTVDDLYDDIDSVVANFFNNTYLGVPETLKGFTAVNISDPILITGNQRVMVEIRFSALFKININYS